ncbi:CpsB/CapC family capsule biosynthesis tyrosine phosphatase [Candidatus Izemoplasma sp. B36]|uniref:CpsB/CapC family capsule biosynthesis tyrosine phosphatase n=1 Tax=Candidatus Izemoplasma sp. B36 TaxID=3242468 RepID=UPI003557AB7F
MIDIHTHILPNVDDGSPDLETSIELIKNEINQGVTDIFVTPHYYKYRGYLSSSEQNKKIFDMLVDRVNELELKINLYLGMEVYYTIDMLKLLENNTLSTMNHSSYVLIEFSLNKELESIPEAINNLTAKGYVPIIAHPERYPYLTKISEYEYIKRMGALIQVNASSINGYYGRKVKKFVLNLIKNNLVDFVASDIHSFRTSKLLDAYNLVKKQFSEETAKKLFFNKLFCE